MKKLFSSIVVISLIGWIVYWASSVFNFILSEWDEGNVLYAPVAVVQGKIPNIDFAYGIPGLILPIQLFAYKVIQSPIAANKIVTLCFSLLSGYLMFLLGLRLFGFLVGVLLLINVIWLTYFVWPLLNAGYASAAFGCAGAYLGFRALSIHSGAKPVLAQRYWLLVSAFFSGASLGFKQSGLFHIIGFIQFAVAMLPRDVLSRSVRITLWIVFVLCPLLGFVAIRVVPNFGELPWNTVALTPWFFAVLLCLKEILSETHPSGAPKMRVIVLSALSLGAGATLWMVLYPNPVFNIPMIIAEIFFRMPALIDRQRDPVFLNLLPGRADLQGYFLLLSPTQWETYILPSILASLAGFLLLIRPSNFLPTGERFLIFLGFSVIAGLYPYPGNERYAAVGLVVSFLSLALYARRALAPVKWASKIASPLMVCSLIGSLYHIQKITFDRNRLPLAGYSNLGIEVRPIEKHRIFFDVADRLKTLVQAGDTLGGYPNYALVFALLERTVWDKFPNFIGDENDFNALVRSIESGIGPDYFVVSPDNYPYAAGYPYFPPPDPLLKALSQHYFILEKFQTGEREVRIYKKTVPYR